MTSILPNLATKWEIGLAIALVSILLIIWAVWRSKSESSEMKEIVGTLDDAT